MSTITSKPSLTMTSLRMVYIFIFILFISENSFSLNKWNRDQVKVKYKSSDNSINITCVFINYEFGPFGENAFLEWGDFSYTHDGKVYYRLLRCVVKNQVQKMASWVLFKNKLLDSKIDVTGCNYPIGNIVLKDYTDLNVEFSNFSKKSCFGIKWFLPDKFRVTHILFNGSWKVEGLFCSEYISGEVYKVKRYSKSQKNEVKIFTHADAVVIEGVECGKNIKVFNTSGAQVKSIVTNNDVAIINLPKNQVYIIKVGQSRYKVVL